MTDRWNPRLVTRPKERELKVFVPDGTPPATSTVEPRGKTWGIRRRGDLEGHVQHAYRCPVHGVFDRRVPRSEVPDSMPCPTLDRASIELMDADGAVVATAERCEASSPWAGSSCGIGHAAGEVTS